MNIDMQNYEEWLVAFVDGELDDVEIGQLNRFLEKHPALKNELTAYKTVVFSADNSVVYDHKNDLRKTSIYLTFLKKSWPIAAAVAVILSLLPFAPKEEKVEPVIASKEVIKKTQDTTLPEQGAIAQMEKTTLSKEPSIPKTKVPQPPLVTKRSVKPVNKRIKESKKITEGFTKNKNPEVETKQELVQEKEISQEPNTLTPEPESKTVEVVVQNDKQEELNDQTRKDEQPATEQEDRGLVVIKEVTHPQLFEKINTVVTKVENKIEIFKELKRRPITVSIGKRKLFTLNN